MEVLDHATLGSQWVFVNNRELYFVFESVVKSHWAVLPDIVPSGCRGS